MTRRNVEPPHTDDRCKFTRGNPGRPRGARHKASLAVEQLLDVEAEALSRKAIELALAGDVTALRLCLERICPPRKDAPVVVDLPQMSSASDAANAMAAIAAAVARGELTPQEGAAFAGLSRRRSMRGAFMAETMIIAYFEALPPEEQAEMTTDGHDRRKRVYPERA